MTRIVCHCNEVGEREIRRAVREGARSLRDVARACGAGACCGSCAPAVAAVVACERSALEPTPCEAGPALSPAR